MLRGFSTGGLRSRLVLLVLLTLLPVIVASTIATLRQRRLAREQFLAAARETTVGIAADLDRVLVSTRRLFTLAENIPAVRAGGPGCESVLRELRDNDPVLTSVGFTDADGHPLCATPSIQGDGTAWAKRLTEGVDFFVGETRSVPGSPQRLLVVVHPVASSGHVDGAMYATFSLAWLDRLLSFSSVAGRAVVNVIDEDGIILYRSERPEGFVGTRVSNDVLQRIRNSNVTGVDAAGLDGVRRRYVIASWGSSARRTLTLAAGFPTADVLQPFDDTVRTQLLFLAIGVLVAIVGVSRVAQRLVLGPVEALVAATGRVRAGDLSTRVTPAGGGEIRELSSAFNLTVEALQRGRDLEEQLRRAQRLQAIGQLAGGVAHEFNNMLTVILGHTDMLLDAEPDRPELLAIRDAADRSRLLTQQLLAFSRRQLLSPIRTSLNDLVQAALASQAPALGPLVTVKLDLSDDDPHVLVDAGQFEHVLGNLLVNAAEAMSRRGTLTVATTVVAVSAGSTARLPDGRYVELSIADSGPGMDAETLARAMEPFFTTRPNALGAGLGLSTAYGIVRQSDGDLTLSSVVGRGTTVRIYLPLAP